MGTFKALQKCTKLIAIFNTSTSIFKKTTTFFSEITSFWKHCLKKFFWTFYRRLGVASAKRHDNGCPRAEGQKKYGFTTLKEIIKNGVALNRGCIFRGVSLKGV